MSIVVNDPLPTWGSLKSTQSNEPNVGDDVDDSGESDESDYSDSDDAWDFIDDDYEKNRLSRSHVAVPPPSTLNIHSGSENRPNASIDDVQTRRIRQNYMEQHAISRAENTRQLNAAEEYIVSTHRNYDPRLGSINVASERESQMIDQGRRYADRSGIETGRPRVSFSRPVSGTYPASGDPTPNSSDEEQTMKKRQVFTAAGRRPQNTGRVSAPNKSSPAAFPAPIVTIDHDDTQFSLIKRDKVRHKPPKLLQYGGLGSGDEVSSEEIETDIDDKGEDEVEALLKEWTMVF